MNHVFLIGTLMNTSGLTTLLFGSGINTTSYGFHSVSAKALQQLGAEIIAIAGASISEGPSLTFVEVGSEQTIWLITRHGHFAHPSMLKRSLSGQGATRLIQVSGITAGSPDVIKIWMDQFREQDAQMSRAFN
jgi:hypothetical protein